MTSLQANEIDDDEAAPESSVDDLLRPVRHVMASLLRSDALSRGDVDAALRNVTEVAAQVLRVGRASVWTYDAPAAAIHCTDLFEVSTRAHSAGATIPATAAPRYFAAVREARSIVANDAMMDPRTADFAGEYLPLHGITSMLDVPVLLRGELYGVLCAEHVGPGRHWAFWEELVACTLADYVAMVVGAHEHVTQARELHDYRTRLEQLVEERTSALRRAEDDLRIAFEASPVGLLITNARTNEIVAANARAAELFEHPLSTLREARSTDFWIDTGQRAEVVEKLAGGGTVEGYRARMRTAKGREFWAELNLRLVDRAGDPCFLAGVRDVTDQVRAEEILVQSRETLRKLFDAAPFPMILVGLEDGVVRHANDRAVQMFRVPMTELVGRPAPVIDLGESERASFGVRMQRDGRVDGLTGKLERPGTTPLWLLINANVIDVEGERCFFVSFADLTEQKKLETRLEELASTDGLTGALNRRRLFELAEIEIARADRYERPLSVAMVDADYFKRLNDERGHAAGDEALKRLAAIAMRDLRRVDHFTRYGGEEFVALLPETDGKSAQHVCERLRERIEIETREAGAPFTVSIGVVERRVGESVADVIRRADEAMYEAKREGRNRVKLVP